MKRTILILTLLITLSLACSLNGLTGGGDDTVTQNEPPPQSENRCGDDVCDGPENTDNCPEDCNATIPDAGEAAAPSEENNVAGMANAEYSILYHIVEHTVASNQMSGAKCYTFTFRKYLDGGHVQPDGSGNEILELQDYPTSMITSKKHDNFYYISSPISPIFENYGIEMFDWDVEGQTLWASAFANNNPVEFAKSVGGKFPGGATTSPENEYLVYLITQKTGENQSQPGGFMPNNMNPFLSDSNLIVANLKNGGETTALSGNYNRQLFTSLADLSADGNSFYTIAKEGESFQFVKISLESGKATGFPEIFPGFDWRMVNWDELFPKANDFAYASFSISPDEKRLIAYKNIFTANLDNPCFTEASHHLWVFNLEENTTDSFKNQDGYVSDSAWKYDSSEFTLSIMGSSGCYPDYLDSSIEILDKDGENRSTLVNEPKSKITNLGWSPDGSVIVYDVYTTDLIGRLKLVDVSTKQVDEIINTQALGYAVSQSAPVTLLFADWVSTK